MPRRDYTGFYALQVHDHAWIVVELRDTTPVPRESKVYRTENEALQAGLDRQQEDEEIARRQAEYRERARARSQR